MNNKPKKNYFDIYEFYMHRNEKRKKSENKICKKIKRRLEYCIKQLANYDFDENSTIEPNFYIISNLKKEIDTIKPLIDDLYYGKNTKYIYNTL